MEKKKVSLLVIFSLLFVHGSIAFASENECMNIAGKYRYQPSNCTTYGDYHAIAYLDVFNDAPDSNLDLEIVQTGCEGFEIDFQDSNGNPIIGPYGKPLVDAWESSSVWKFSFKKHKAILSSTDWDPSDAFDYGVWYKRTMMKIDQNADGSLNYEYFERIRGGYAAGSGGRICKFVKVAK